MVDEDEYSNKDSNHNRMLEVRESYRYITIIVIALAVIGGIYLYYYYHMKPHIVVPAVSQKSVSQLLPSPTRIRPSLTMTISRRMHNKLNFCSQK
jgi:hypothetical protein